MAGDGVLRALSEASSLVWRDGLRVADGATAGTGWFLGFAVVERAAAVVVGIAALISVLNWRRVPFNTEMMSDFLASTEGPKLMVMPPKLPPGFAGGLMILPILSTNDFCRLRR